MSVYADGPKTSKIAAIAEAPAWTEMKVGKPLVGPSGRVFELCLHSCGLVRGAMYVGNLSREPVKSDKALLEKDGWTELGEEEYALFAQRVRELDANVIVSMGNVALYALTGKRGITKWRGSILPCTVPGAEGRKIVPTYHPAAALRGQYMWRYDIITDFARAKRESTTAGIKPQNYELITDPSYERVMDYLASCETAGRFAHDVEIYNYQISCMSFAYSTESAICIPFYDNRKSSKHRWNEEEEVAIWTRIAEVLEGGHQVIGQNYSFDMYVLLRNNGILPKGQIDDLMIAHHILWPDLPKGLDYICSVHTDIPYYKDDRKLWDKIDEEHDEFWLYSARDAIATMIGWEAIVPDLEADSDYMETYRFTLDLYEPLLYMMMRGMYVNRERLATLKKKIEGDLAVRLQELHEISDYEFNPNSPKQCIEYFYEHKGIKPYINRKTGGPTADDKALQRLYRQKGLPEARVVQEWRNLSTLLTRSLEMTFDPDSRMRCTVNPRGTRMGRLSTGQTLFGTGGNMQNLETRFKDFIEPG